MTLPPQEAVFSIASKTVKWLKVYAWQPMKNPPVLNSSGILFSAWAREPNRSAIPAIVSERARVFMAQFLRGGCGEDKSGIRAGIIYLTDALTRAIFKP